MLQRLVSFGHPNVPKSNFSFKPCGKLNQYSHLKKSPKIIGSRSFSLNIVPNYSNSSILKNLNEASKMNSNTKGLLEGLLSGKRTSLAQSITLAESSREDHRIQADLLMSSLLEWKTKEKTLKKTFRIGISGPPGVGKSSFIESMGTFLCKEGYKVAVLAVDPSSARTGGSILGDVTRMEELTKQPGSYVRGSPSRGTLGGVTRSTTDAIILCEVAGYDVILVETVGVGQSETAVEGMTDMFLLLSPPAGGDELQGIKKGIMELVDLVVVNKADGELLSVAKRAATDFKSALHFGTPKTPSWIPQVKICSAKTKENIPEVWKVMKKYWTQMDEEGILEMKRKNQRKAWMWKMVQDELVKRFQNSDKIKEMLGGVQKEVEEGHITAHLAAEILMNKFISSNKTDPNT
eukprot:TRINITY_DN6486_c0_g1_i4.p1 TRINITY_DN6486_c0_g1~~TRINITY_DN6486_c0_g1_i4.p1  ORF type:complete len:406 (-),score=128.19 TRINITY_DN6486_c0_g1_i4:219-1436(-)